MILHERLPTRINGDKLIVEKVSKVIAWIERYDKPLGSEWQSISRERDKFLIGTIPLHAKIVDLLSRPQCLKHARKGLTRLYRKSHRERVARHDGKLTPSLGRDLVSKTLTVDTVKLIGEHPKQELRIEGKELDTLATTNAPPRQLVRWPEVPHNKRNLAHDDTEQGDPRPLTH
jgi:hypothetical protein